MFASQMWRQLKNHYLLYFIAHSQCADQECTAYKKEKAEHSGQFIALQLLKETILA